MASRKDPLTTFSFGLTIVDLKLDYSTGTAYFKSVSGLKTDTQVTDYQEGGVTGYTRKVIGVTKWPNLVLKQGFTGDEELWSWKDKPKRVNGTIVQLGPSGKVVCQWEFVNGYPVKWEGPDFAADKGELAIETIEIAHEGLKMTRPGAEQPAPPPPAPPPPPPAPPVNANVSFPTNSSTVPSPNPGLDAAAQACKDDPEKKIKIEGHTDSTGSRDYNVSLSQKRADAAKDYLIKQGTDPAQIVSCKGYGPDQPIADNKTEAGRAQNRRTTVTDA